jgi:hypothetical protein
MFKKLLNDLLLEYFAPPLDLPPDSKESLNQFHRLMLFTKYSVDELIDTNTKITKIPETLGIYWYWNAEMKIPDFQICEVKEKDGNNVLRFMDGSYQRFVGENCFLVSKLVKPEKE